MDHGSGGHHIQVGEQHSVCRGKVLIADIAPTDDGSCRVRRVALVVHAPLGARELGQIAQGLGRAQRKGVEQAYFDIGVLVERGKGGIEATRAAIIEQQAHTHATICGQQQFVQQQVACGVVAPDVVLHVERALCRPGQQGAGRKRVIGVGQEVNAAFTRMDLLQRCQPLTQLGLPGLFGADGMGFRALGHGREPAAGEQTGQKQAGGGRPPEWKRRGCSTCIWHASSMPQPSGAPGRKHQPMRMGPGLRSSTAKRARV